MSGRGVGNFTEMEKVWKEDSSSSPPFGHGEFGTRRRGYSLLPSAGPAKSRYATAANFQRRRRRRRCRCRRRRRVPGRDSRWTVSRGDRSFYRSPLLLLPPLGIILWSSKSGGLMLFDLLPRGKWMDIPWDVMYIHSPFLSIRGGEKK